MLFCVTNLVRLRVFFEIGLLSAFFNGRLSSCEACHRHTERAAAHVVHTVLVEELGCRRVAAMFATDAALEVGASATATLDTHLHQLADTFLVEVVERVGGDNLLVDIGLHDGVDVVAAETEGHLGQVVGTEAEELGHFGNLVGNQRYARNFNHGAELVVELDAGCRISLPPRS